MEQHKRDQHEHRPHDDKSARNKDVPKQAHRTPDKQGDPNPGMRRGESSRISTIRSRKELALRNATANRETRASGLSERIDKNHRISVAN
jgi:hypothetical protein